MPLSFHGDRPRYFNQQYENTARHVIPFIESVTDVAGKQVLEVGCGEGGVLKPFLDRRCTCIGVDLNQAKIDYAQEALKEDIDAGQATVIAADIYDKQFQGAYEGRFDIIVLKDTIEHIYDQEKILRKLKPILSKEGVVFLGFPPWFMPYGGHQQIARSTLAQLPYYHLLPRSLYRGLLEIYGESEEMIEALMEIVDTRLSIQRFEQLIRKTGYQTCKRQFYLINPIYEYKFGLRPRMQLPILRSVPWLRDFLTTTCYYVIKPDSTEIE
jgi:ubiquinone/menaquinone biosynthesis C-methylase UbiE